MSEITQDQVHRLIAQFTGQRNVIAVPRLFVKWTGSLEAALLLNQLIYWSERTTDPEGWIYKKAEDLEEEICLSEYQIRKARKVLEPYGVESKVKTVRGTAIPVVHYRINKDQFYKSILQFLSLQTENSQKANLKIAEYTKSTTEITSEITPYLPATPVLVRELDEATRPQPEPSPEKPEVVHPDQPVSRKAETVAPPAHPFPPRQPGLSGEALAVFDQLWAKYPLLKGVKGTKKLARGQFALVDPSDWADILRGVDKLVQRCGHNGETALPPYAENFLKDEKWRDLLDADLSRVPATNGNGHHPPEARRAMPSEAESRAATAARLAKPRVNLSRTAVAVVEEDFPF